MLHNFHEFVSLIWCIINTYIWQVIHGLRVYLFTLDFGLLHCKVIEFSTGCISYTKDVITNIFRNSDMNFEECS